MNNPSFAGVFVWGNYNNGSLVNLNIFNNNGYTSEHLVFGRELFNEANIVGIGPLASRPATCTVGPPRSAYIATDQNEQGATIYVATATNVWTKYWEPYNYPHPLTETSNGTPPPLGSPTGLRLVE